ncbi:heavy metal translocating P-type ATPase [Legionella oakridgensis]|uniref:Cation transporting ATPase PacS n=1 Tax=Legionella oakridgensis TaxID=29423 RepID=A0A0W0X294_9GAMM|nr:heavy metal translocating P-type ATPase [Legionella oakridgensis]KTD38689.1 cation transporting ATPase PacS [Legionella oakridgensis]STY20873.1 cation transporting ATPase PacS [Legionella longbeachae]
MTATTYCFSLPGIRCVNCVRPIEQVLRTCKTMMIEDFSVEVVEKKLTIRITNDGRSPAIIRELIRKTLDEVGVEAVDLETPAEEVQSPLPDALDMAGVDSAGIEMLSTETLVEEPKRRIKKNSFFKKILNSHWFWGLLGTAGGVALLVLSLTGITVSLPVLIAIGVGSIALSLLLGAESYYEAIKKLFKTKALTMDTLFAISTLTVMIVSVAAFFFPWLPMMFEASLLIFGFRHLGIAIEESIKQTIDAGKHFKDRVPKMVRQLVVETIKHTPLTMIKPGDVILIQPGEIIPVDGVCEGEESQVFETIVTGSTLPRPIRHGESLLAGMVLAEGASPLRLKVSAAVGDSYLAQLDAQIARTNFEKAPLETATNKILQYFIPAVILFALISATVISFFFPMALAIKCAVAVLVSACPCTLGFITPLAVKIGMNKAAEHGVQFKSAKTLQEAEQIDSVVFDLNGTLTTGVPSVRHYEVIADSGLTANELMAYAAVLEQHSQHPVAKAICKFAKKHDVRIASDVHITEVDASNHSGLKARINGELYVIGNENMMDEQGIETQDLRLAKAPEGGDSMIYLARDRKVVGYILLSDPLRHNARHAVDSLKELGKQVYICTGADTTTARRYAKLLGIPTANIRAACVGSSSIPVNDKEAYIKQLKQQGRRVAMIGDAANDAVAIAASDFGIAIKSRHSDEVTQQQAGAVIQSGSLLPVVSAFAVAQQAVNNIKQNLLMSLGYNLASMLIAGGLLLAIGVSLNPAVGVALMILQSSLLLLNAYRFKQQSLKHLQASDADGMEQTTLSSYRRLHASMPTHGTRIQRDALLEEEQSPDERRPLTKSMRPCIEPPGVSIGQPGFC